MTVELARVAGAVAAGGLAALILASTPRWRLAGLAVCAAGALAIAVWLAPSGHAPTLAASGVVLALAAAVLAVLVVRVPWALALLALACVPLRVAVTVGDEHAQLLLPLYAVVAAGGLALAWELARGDRRARELGAAAWPVALLVAWSGLSLLWSDAPRTGAIDLLCFVLPLALLAAILARLPRRPDWERAAGIELVALGLLFATVGGWEYLTRDVVVESGERLTSSWYFAVDSVFDDPGAYARFLAVALLVAASARTALRWPAWAAALALSLGLVVSFSRPAFLAVAAGLLVALAAVWSRRAAVAALVVVAAAAVALASVTDVRAHVLARPGVHATAAVAPGARFARDHALAGAGLGAYHARPLRHEAVTVAAETGILGLALLAWTVVAGLRTARGGVLGLILLALVVDALFRAGLLEEPLFWGALGLAAAAARPAAEN